MKKNIILITFLLALFATPLSGYNFDKCGIRNFSMGSTGIAQSTDLSASIYNPALLTQLKDFGILTDTRFYIYNMDNDDVSYNSFIIGFPIASICVTSVSASTFYSNLYQELRIGVHSGTFLFGDKLKIGAGLNRYSVEYDSNEFSANDPFFLNNGNAKEAYDFDLGAAYLINMDMQMGIVGRNILQSSLALDTSNEDAVPREVGFGFTYRIKPQWLLVSDLNYKMYRNDVFDEFTYSFGTEYRLFNNFALRSGFNNTEVTCGFGLLLFERDYLQSYRDPLTSHKLINTKNLALSIDYGFSYPIFSEIEIPYGNHFLGLEFRFGNSTTDEQTLASNIPPRIETKIVKEPFKAEPASLPTIVDTIYIEIEKILRDTVYVVDTVRVLTGVSMDEYLRKAKELDSVRLELKDYKDLNEALIHITKATKFYYLQDLNNAAKECLMAIKLAPNMALAYIKLGSIYYRMGDTEKAYANWRIAKRIDPDNPELKDVFKE
ncbi:MAG: hypothetical protein JXR56_05385 [Candidatus Cloacimonetes bacterium]|nr:hypothetical protein [Candidatus Cloacimonadota bacterium]